MGIVSCNPPDSTVKNTPRTGWLQESSRPAIPLGMCASVPGVLLTFHSCYRAALLRPRWFGLGEKSDLERHK